MKKHKTLRVRTDYPGPCKDQERTLTLVRLDESLYCDEVEEKFPFAILVEFEGDNHLCDLDGEVINKSINWKLADVDEIPNDVNLIFESWGE